MNRTKVLQVFLSHLSRVEGVPGTVTRGWRFLIIFFRMPTPNACKMHHNLTVGFRNEHHLGYKERLKMRMGSFVLMLRGIVTVADKPHKLIIRVRFPAPPPCRHSTTGVQLTCNHLIGVRFTVAAPYIKSLIGVFVCRLSLVRLDSLGRIFIV